MATPEGQITVPDVSSSPATTSGAQPDASSASSVATGTQEGDAGSVTTPVQGADSQPDIFADLPSVEELQAQAGQGVKYAAALANLRGQIEPIRTEFSEYKTRLSPYEETLARFENPEQLQSAIGIYDSLIGYERDGSDLVPSTAKGAQMLSEQYPLHADYLAADLLNGQTVDPLSGQRMSRMDAALSALSPSAIGKDPELAARRAETLRLLGAVEPSSISPQWQPSAEELEVIKPELQEVYKKLPYEEREELKLSSPDYINRVLEREKYTQQLQAEREQSQQREQAQAQQREQYISQQASQAGEKHLGSLLNERLTTFHNSVVGKCDFIKPIDLQNLPQGLTGEQATQMNAQIDASNKAAAAEISGIVIALQNEQTRSFVVPLLQQVGVIDDKFLREMDAAASGFADNARNYGELVFRGQLTSNGNGYKPDGSVTGLGNEANRNLAKLTSMVSQIADRLIEKRSQFFALKAGDYNQTLNRQLPRPSVTGSTYNPSTAAVQPNHDPHNPWPTKAQLEQQYG